MKLFFVFCVPGLLFIYVMELYDVFIFYFSCYFQCKHLLAARFASAVGECIEVKLSDEDLALLLANI